MCVLYRHVYLTSDDNELELVYIHRRVLFRELVYHFLKRTTNVDGYVYRQTSTLKNGDIVYASTSPWLAGGNMFMKPG
jgi:phosphatidate phosphatase APP1